MSNFIVVPDKKEDIDSILSKDIKGVILGLDNLSIYNCTLSLEKIISIANNTDKDVIIAINKMIHNSDLEFIESSLKKIEKSKINKILFYDLGIFNICKRLGIKKELVLGQEHLNASISSNTFYNDLGIKSSFITSDITYNEILDIKNNTNMKIYYTVYGYLPIFYSRRMLLSNYFKYINKDMLDDKYYVFNNNLKYLIKEKNFGTIIYSSPINLVNDINKIKDIDFLVIDLSYTNDISIIDSFINHKVVDNPYKGFFDTKTVYKIEDFKVGQVIE